MQFNCKMGYSGNEQDYQLIKTSISELKKYSNQKEVLRYLTNVLPNPTDVVTLDNAQNTVKSVKAQLANKNLLPYPYYETTKTQNGITFTDNGDGSVTVNGTASSASVFQLFNSADGSKLMNVANRTITISGCPSGGSLQSYFLLFSYGGNSYQDFGDSITKTPNADITAVQLRIAAGTTVNNLTFKPQIELGTTATAYTPYISDFSTVNVKTYGKNLFNKSTLRIDSATKNLTQINNGFTFQTNATKTTMSVTCDIFLNVGTYYCSGTVSSSDGLNGGWGVYDPIKGVYIINASSRGTVNDKFTITESKTYKLSFFASYNSAADVTMTFTNIQIELGITATDYEPYQGQTYTPTATGEVTGIEVLTPTTNIINDKDLLFTKVTGDDFNYIS